MSRTRILKPISTWKIVSAALMVLFVGILVQPWFLVTWNASGSLPGAIFLLVKGQEVKRGDLVAFRWHGGSHSSHSSHSAGSSYSSHPPHYPAGLIFIKRVVGLPGDHVIREGESFYVGDQHVGIAKSHSKSGFALSAAGEGPILPGEMFVAGDSPDSFDSRYLAVGNVRFTAVIGRAYVVF